VFGGTILIRLEKLHGIFILVSDSNNTPPEYKVASIDYNAAIFGDGAFSV
jgi:hypothetical protein